MSNIYDEALKEYNEVYFGAMPTVVKALERAKKEHKLLKLRERQIVLERKRRNKTITIAENTEYHELLESCKQLEEELK